MNTFDQVQEKIRSHFKAAPSRSETLCWERETASTLVTSCNRFRISRVIENGSASYFASEIATPTSAPKSFGVRFVNADQAKEACAFRVTPMPQA